MSADLTRELIKTAPEMLVALAVTGVLAWLLLFHRNALRKKILSISKISVLGVEIALAEKAALDEAVNRHDLQRQVSEGDRRGALGRAHQVRPVLDGARVLWVDDHPDNNRPLTDLLHRFGVVVDTATSTAEAQTLARRHRYEVIVSDIDRGNDREAGLEMLALLEADGTSRWTIFYVQQLQTAMLPGGKYKHPMVPLGGFAITNRPDHLLHYVMDVLERERWELVPAR